MKNLLLLLIFFSFSVSYSQEKELSKEEKAKRQRNIDAVNPFARFGYKPKIGTLSKGKYLEIQKIDSVVQIGSYRFNQVTGKVAGFVEVDTLYSEATLRPEIISRWFNPDPLSEEFPSWSPYNFTLNNPILFIDPDGRAPKVANCCGFFSTGAGIGLAFRRIKNTANYMRQGNSITTAYLMASGDDAIDATKQTLRYVTPAEDIYGVATGQDFYGNEYNRASAGAWTAASFIPFAKLGKVIKMANKVEANAINKAFKNAPYDEAFDVIEGLTKNSENFVRAHTKSNKIGSWVMKADEIKGLSPAQIQNKFSLPNLPSHVSDVLVPKNTNIRTGVANKVKGWGNGGGTQFELLDKIPQKNFSNTRVLDNF